MVRYSYHFCCQFFRGAAPGGWYVVFCWQVPPMPLMVAMHCSKVVKPQLRPPPALPPP
jgi:hypothetical protein